MPKRMAIGIVKTTIWGRFNAKSLPTVLSGTSRRIMASASLKNELTRSNDVAAKKPVPMGPRHSVKM